MEITALESIRIFGLWDQPHHILTWNDIIEKKYTWRSMRYMGLSAERLFGLQSGIAEWICRGNLRLVDLPDMTIFPVNPFTDLRADIGEVILMKWSHDTLKKMGVTYDQLIKTGMSPQIIPFFNISLSAWVLLGLKTEHALKWTEQESTVSFGISHTDLLRILRDQEVGSI